MTAAKALIFVIDDDAAICRAVKRLLQTAHYDVETFASAPEFLARKAERGPGCLILDLQLEGLNGLELQQTLAASGRLLPIIFISGQGDIPSSVRAMKAGAIDFLTKPFDDAVLLDAVQNALEKDEHLRRAQSERRSVDSRLQQLTDRESQVLSLVVHGRLNKQIAYKLGISEKTVKVHRARVMEKMRVKSLAELVRLTEKTAVVPGQG